MKLPSKCGNWLEFSPVGTGAQDKLQEHETMLLQCDFTHCRHSLHEKLHFP